VHVCKITKMRVKSKASKRLFRFFDQKSKEEFKIQKLTCLPDQLKACEAISQRGICLWASLKV